jgi:hypothetical protein
MRVSRTIALALTRPPSCVPPRQRPCTPVWDGWFAAISALFAVALLAVLPATLTHSELTATSVLGGVAIVLAIGEIAHILVLGPLVADMAPAHLLGRYLSTA